MIGTQPNIEEMAFPMQRPSAMHLQKMATIFSRLSPLFAHLRRMPELAGNTLLPNALSPIAPAMAYGSCGRLDHGNTRRKLQEYQAWTSSSAALAGAYQAYREASGNALLWAGWNYWDPTKAEQSERRVVQVVLTEDLLECNPDLLNSSRPLLERNGESLLTVGEFQQPPVPDAPKEVLLGEHLSNDVDLVPEALVAPRLFLHNIWRQVFVPSIRTFSHPGSATIVDHLLHEHADYDRALDSLRGQDFMALFQADGATRENVRIEGIRQFQCAQAWTDILWAEVSEKFTQIQVAARPSNGGPKKSTVLRHAWQLLAESEDELNGKLSQPLSALATALGPHVQPTRQAYVIFQHLALFDRFALSRNQYVFPLVFGRHLVVAFLAMKKPLTGDDAAGWQQVVSALFGGLLAELLSQLNAETQIRHEARRRADEQRLMLSHSLPKSVFKPAEYFAVRLREQALHLDAQSDALAKRSHSGTLTPMSEAVLFLLQKGQAEISDYAQGVAWEEDKSSAVNLRSVCADIAKHSKILAEFFIAGYIDRGARVAGRPKGARATALDRTKIHLMPSKDELDPPLVRLNRGLLFLHLWNVVDNAFRHADLANDGLVLTFDIETEPEWVCLIATNSGEQIPDYKAEVLNELFAAGPASDNLDGLRLAIHQWGAEKGADSEFEAENRGVGLYRFNAYLASLWEKCGKPETVRGAVAKSGNGSRFAFYFPRASE